LPVVKINGTLRGISFKIRYDSVKPHYRFVLEYLIGELPVLWSRLSRRKACWTLMTWELMWVVQSVHLSMLIIY